MFRRLGCSYANVLQLLPLSSEGRQKDSIENREEMRDIAWGL